MSWLSSTFKRNRGWIGNALKNFAPVAGALTGGLGGVAIGALGSMAGRGIQEGANLGNIAKQGVSGGSIAYGGSKALGGLRSLFAPSSSAMNTVTSAGGEIAPAAVESAGLEGGNIAASRPLATRVASRAGGAARWANDNPMAAAMALQGTGTALNAPSENRYRDAQTRALESQTASDEEERQRRKRLEDAMEPLRRLLAGQMGAGNPYTVAPNPYA